MWKCEVANTLYAFWSQLLGVPHEYDMQPGGSAVWYGDRLGAATFLGHALPFYKFMIYDRKVQPAVALIKVYMSPTAAKRVNQITIAVRYDENQHMLSVSDNTVSGLVASMIIAQRVQSGAVAPNVTTGLYISMRQNIMDEYGQIKVEAVREMYDAWYAAWAAGTSTAPVSTQERFALGIRSTVPFAYANKEQLSGVSNLLSAELQYDSMQPDA